MNGWMVAFIVVLVWHVVTQAVSMRLIYWQRRHIDGQRRHIDALKESARLDEQIYGR